MLSEFLVSLIRLCYYRLWNPIPSNGLSRTDYLTHMQTPDGTYLASEFNYSLPRHQKGYDTIGFKYRSGDRAGQLDHPTWTDVRTKGENGKGYYSDHAYESPRCGLAQMANSGLVGYRQVSADENEAGAESRQSNDSFSKGDPRVTKLPRTLTFPRHDIPDGYNLDRGTLQHNLEYDSFQSGMALVYNQIWVSYPWWWVQMN